MDPFIKGRLRAPTASDEIQMLFLMARCFWIGLILSLLFSDIGSSGERANVLFIAVDDLRPQLACYGKPFMKSPNLDALAKRGVLFERAYCMVPTCGASRASLMTGIRPHPRRFVSYTARADEDAPGIVTLNDHFKRNGYETISLGKVFHNVNDHAEGWSEKPWRPTGQDYRNPAEAASAARQHDKKYPDRKKKARGPAFESANVPDEEYRDGQVATKAIEYLKQLSADPDGSPFFLAVGFFKPHLPFVAPQKYWDMYEHEAIDLPENYWAPKNAPEEAVHSSGELRAYAGIPPTSPVDRETARQLIHGYYACVSFTDAQIGRVLAALDRSGQANNTIIVLWGDHGWQLGEHGMWNKHSCFETSMHAPLIIVPPRDSGVNAGARVSALTEFIDIYPTLCDLSGITLPSHLEGQSLVPLMKDPSGPGKPFAVGRFGAGDTIRSDHHRYSEYHANRGIGKLTGRMLYDHRVDPDENTNVAEDSANQGIVETIATELHGRQEKP